MEREKGWNLLCKFFDNMGPIPASHAPDAMRRPSSSAARGKPEAYYFPPQYNKTDNNFPHTFMGLEPGTTKDDVRRCLENWNKGDNGILFLSRAFRLEPGTGWQIDPGILHAPGSLVTYEPQVASDVFAMFQSEVEGRITPWALMTKDVPPENHQRSRLPRRPAGLGRERQSDVRCRQPLLPQAREAVRRDRSARATASSGSRYGTGWYSAKELTVLPKRTVTIKDAAAYGIILTQGYGSVRHAAGVDAGDDPIRTDDGGRAVRHRGRRAPGRQDREPERDRSARHPETLRAGQSGCRAAEAEKLAAPALEPCSCEA